MANLGGYDATGGETMGDRSVLPAGPYVAAMVKSDRKEAKSGNGSAYINCEFEVMEGERKGARFWSILNLWNQNSQAVEIAQRELNSIMQACGRLRVDDTEELHGIPMRVTLKIEAGQGSYGDSNRVTSYKPLNEQQGTQPGFNQSGGNAAGGKPWNSNAA